VRPFSLILCYVLASSNKLTSTSYFRSGSVATYNLLPPPGSPPTSPLDPLSPPTLSHTSALRDSLNTTASALATGPVTCLAWCAQFPSRSPFLSPEPPRSPLSLVARRTSDGYALASGFARGYALWSTYGRLGSWSVAGALDSSSAGGGAGHGVEGDKSDAFEDHFMEGVRACFFAQGDAELIVLCPPPVHPKRKGASRRSLLLSAPLSLEL